MLSAARSRRSFRLAFVVLILSAMLLPPRSPQAQEREDRLRLRDQQICMVALNRALQKIVRSTGQTIYNCLRNHGTGRLLGSVEACIAADPRGRVVRMRTRLFEDSADRCSFPLDFGPTDPNEIDQAAIALSLDVTHDILGADLDSGVLDSELRDRTKPRCQVLAVRGFSRNIDSRLRTYNFCKSAGLRAGSITSSAGLEDCVSQDPRGSVASANLRLQRDIGGACINRLVPLDDAFPGCGTSDGSVLQACIVKSTACRVCLALNQADDLNVNCDLFDDGVADASCS